MILVGVRLSILEPLGQLAVDAALSEFAKFFAQIPNVALFSTSPILIALDLRPISVAELGERLRELLCIHHAHHRQFSAAPVSSLRPRFSLAIARFQRRWSI